MCFPVSLIDLSSIRKVPQQELMASESLCSAACGGDDLGS